MAKDQVLNTEELLAAQEGFSDSAESLWEVFKRRFRKHTLGKIGAAILVLLYLCAFLAAFLSPFSMEWTDKAKSYHPPTRRSNPPSHTGGVTAARVKTTWIS